MMPVVHTTPSPRTKELAERLRATIADYQAREAKLTQGEIDAALATVRTTTRGEDRRAVAILLAIVGAFVAVSVGLATAAERAPEGGSMPAAVYLAIAIAVAAAVVGALLARRNS